MMLWENYVSSNRDWFGSDEKFGGFALNLHYLLSRASVNQLKIVRALIRPATLEI